MYDNQALQSGQEEHIPSGFAPSSFMMTEPLLAKSAQPTVHISNSTLIMVPFSLLALWTIAFVYFKQLRKRHNGFNTQNWPKRYKRVPCRQCIFFKNNPYLKCAIRPTDAMTTNAIDCTDYASQDDRQHKP